MQEAVGSPNYLLVGNLHLAVVLDHYKENPRIFTESLHGPFKHLELELIATVGYWDINLLNGCPPLHSAGCDTASHQ